MGLCLFRVSSSPPISFHLIMTINRSAQETISVLRHSNRLQLPHRARIHRNTLPWIIMRFRESSRWYRHSQSLPIAIYLQHLEVSRKSIAATLTVVRVIIRIRVCLLLASFKQINQLTRLLSNLLLRSRSSNQHRKPIIHRAIILRHWLRISLWKISPCGNRLPATRKIR